MCLKIMYLDIYERNLSKINKIAICPKRVYSNPIYLQQKIISI